MRPVFPLHDIQATLLNRQKFSADTAQFALSHLGALSGNITLNEIQLFLQPFFQGMKLFFTSFPPLLTLIHIGGVITPVYFHPSRTHFPNGVDHPVQKIPVMADDENGPIPTIEGTFQPFNRFHIQMIGWLVEDEQIGPF